MTLKQALELHKGYQRITLKARRTEERCRLLWEKSQELFFDGETEAIRVETMLHSLGSGTVYLAQSTR